MGYGLDKGWGSPSRPSTWKISAPAGGYKEGCTPLLAFWATQLLLHSLQNLMATTGQYLKPHPETRVKTSFFLTSCGKNQMPSCSTSSISRQHSEEETRSLRTSESKPIYLKSKSPWLSKSLMKILKLLLWNVFLPEVFFFLQIWVWNSRENQHLLKHLLQSWWQEESTSEGSGAPSSLDSYYSATHLSPFAQHLLLKTLDPKGKSYFETQSDLTYYFKLHSKSLILTSLLPPDDKGIHRLHSGVAFHPFPLLLISHYPRQLKINKTWSSDGWRLNITKQGHQKSDPTSPKETHHRFFLFRKLRIWWLVLY